MKTCPKTLQPTTIKSNSEFNLEGSEDWLKELYSLFIDQDICQTIQLTAEFVLKRQSIDVEHFQVIGEFTINSEVECDRCAAARKLTLANDLNFGIFENLESDSLDAFGFENEIDFFVIFNDLINAHWPNKILCENTAGDEGCVELDS